jgi:thiol-disulfide isomerase/thioredoxin
MKVQLVLFIFSASCLAQNAIPPLNQEAPEIELSRLLQAPGNVTPTLAALRGKAVVMEFWATWCGGCVAAIPHLNQLAEQLKGEPVVFLSITDESPEVVQSFLSRRPMSGWIGIDKYGATFAKYGILGRPQTLLIDRQGVLRLPAQPDRVNAALVDDLISGKLLATKTEVKRPDAVPMELVKGVPPPLLQTLIRPAASPAISGNSPGLVVEASGGRIEYYGVNLKTFLHYAEHVRADRIIAPSWFDQNLYDASIAVSFR